MFVDAHTKVFSLLLDAVCELLLVHWQQLKDWLYQLMFRYAHPSTGGPRLVSLHLQVCYEPLPPCRLRPHVVVEVGLVCVNNPWGYTVIGGTGGVFSQ